MGDRHEGGRRSGDTEQILCLLLVARRAASDFLQS